MTRAILLTLCISIVTFNLIIAQDYSAVDAHALSVSANGDLVTVATALVAPYDTETEQVRSIFTWIAHHVRYDCREFKRAPKDRQARTQQQQIDRAFKRRLAVCGGYANLFVAMCDQVGIEAELVSGYARKRVRCPNPDRLPNSHAWNAVKIDGEWHLLDVTWASGYVTGDCERFKANFYDYYFLTPPAELIRRHWPNDPKWQLLQEPMTAEEYVAQPYFERLPEGARLGEVSPTVGTLSSSAEEYTFRIEIEGPQKMGIQVGSKIHFMESDADDVYSITLSNSELRGRTLKVVYFEDANRYKSIITYQRATTRR